MSLKPKKTRRSKKTMKKSVLDIAEACFRRSPPDDGRAERLQAVRVNQAQLLRDRRLMERLQRQRIFPASP